MIRLIVILAASGFGVVCSASAQATGGPVDSARIALAKSLLVRTGAGQPSSSEMFKSLSQQRQGLPQIRQAVWDSLEAGLQRAMAGLVDSLAPHYAMRFSTEELREIIQFYDSPVGRHLIAEQPAFARVGMQLGQRLAARVLEQFQKELQNSIRND
ncbi:MAG: DUF2059 domain-containing protein [Gemmatimonadales bacterium]|nr:DUF2059 domain-containing protein [Gemmatimonadales bacterium]